jgi:signal transduction histidine kinase
LYLFATRGSGLGLDISYNIIVNKHGGEIKVKSKPGETIFEIKLPVK